MKDIANFQELIDAAAAEGTLPDGWVFRTAGRSSALDCAFVATDSSEDVDLDQIEVDGEELPVVLHERGMVRWIDSATLEDVVSLRLEKTGERDLEDIARAVDYYLENDDFMD